MSGRVFAPPGPLALAPFAYAQAFAQSGPLVTATEGAPEEIPRIYVRGPLLHHPEIVAPDVPWGVAKWFLSYDELRLHAESVIRSAAGDAIVLVVDSPGGVATGFIDCAREIRAMAQAAGKRIVAFVEGHACSAAYGLALAADEIWVSESARVGSIGVIEAIRDQSARDEREGVRWFFAMSGARKADGDPHSPTSEDTIAERQKLVDAAADVFFAFVAERRGLSAGDVRDLEAATFTARAAQAIGLVDGVTTLDGLLARLAASEGENMSVSEAKAALKAIVDGGGDEKDKARARKALAALGADDKPEEEGKAEGDDADKPEEEGKAEGDDADKPKEEGKAKGAASARAAAASASAGDDVARRLAELEARQEQSDRAALYASRPDLTEAQKAALDKLPVAAAREFVGTMPRLASNPVAAARAALVVAPTQGGKHDGGKPSVTNASPYAKQLDQMMGLASEGDGVRVEGSRLIMSAARAPKPEDELRQLQRSLQREDA